MGSCLDYWQDLSSKEKTFLSSVLALGTFTVVVSLMRGAWNVDVGYVQRAKEIEVENNPPSEDDGNRMTTQEIEDRNEMIDFIAILDFKESNGCGEKDIFEKEMLLKLYLLATQLGNLEKTI